MSKSDEKDTRWTSGPKGTLTALKEFVRFGMSLRKFKQYHPNIPMSEIEAKARELSGGTNEKHPAPFLRGIGRIVEEGFKGEELKLRETNFDHPFDTGITDKDWNVAFINGANIGIKHSRVIDENPVRRALQDAEQNGDQAVFLTGIIDVDLKKAAGPLKALRALFSGRNINISVLDPGYREEAQRIIKQLPDDEVVYETSREIFENLLMGWEKIARRQDSNKKPVYSGKTFLIIGPKEEELAIDAAYWEVRYFTLLKLNKILAEIKVATNALARAEADAEAASEEDVEMLTHKLEELRKRESRTRITNVGVEEWYRFYQKALAFIIRRFEEVIPNCKVIGKGTTYVKIGNRVGKIHISEDLRVTDKLLSHYVASCGSEILRQKSSSFIVICSPYALNYRMTAREIDVKGHRESAVKICVAPVCLDGEFLRKSFKSIIRKAHPIGKLVFNEQFCPGVLELSCINEIVNPSSIAIEALGAFERQANGSKSRIIIPPKYIYIMVATDHHYGGRPKEYIWCSELQQNLGVAEATFQIMRREGLFRGTNLPIHIYSSNDDGIQGNHFETHKQPHPHQVSYTVIENEWRKALEDVRRLKSLKSIGRQLADIRDFNLHQFQVRGIDWTQNQIEEVFYRHIEPNIDFFNAVLMRAQKSGLEIRGLSSYTSVPFDSRDLGVINFGTGNHLDRTVNGEIVENTIYAHQARLLLRTMPMWKDRSGLLDRLVKAPLYGRRFIAWGTFQVSGGYTWGADFRDTTPVGVDWNDLLGPTVKNDLRRGNYSRIFENKMTVKTYGDKHYLSMIMTPNAVYLMGPAGTHTDSYGEWGFSPNNTGVVFLGVPAAGPSAGPILLRALLYDEIRYLIEKPKPFDWKKFLPNPV